MTVSVSPILKFAGLAGLLLLAGCGEDTGAPAGAQGGGAPPPEVGVITLEPETIPFRAMVPGRTVATAVSEIRPQVNGIIQKRLFTEGSLVKAGDVLYKIDDRTYHAAVESARAQVARAQAVVTNAQAQFDRYEELRERAVVAQQQYDEARAALEQAKADLALAEANLSSAQINLDFTEVTAPISGVIGTSSVTEGALVTANQSNALATIRQIDPIYLDMTESSANLLRVRRMIDSGEVKRELAQVHLRLEDGTPYNQVGKILAAERAVSLTTGSVTIRASVPNPDNILLPGMFIRATVELQSEREGFLLPQRAVSRNPTGQAIANFVSKDGKAETRVLETEQVNGNSWVVYEGVAEGDRLIVDGLQKIRSGQPVTPVAVKLDAAGVVAQEASAASQKTQE